MKFNYDEIQHALTLYIWKNDHLREEFVKDPKQSIKKHLKLKIDDAIQVKVVNFTSPYEVLFVLPARGRVDELTDEQLDNIICKDEFGDYYNHPSAFKSDVLEKAKILNKHKKQEKLLECE